MGTVCETPSPESSTIPVVRPDAYSDSTAWIATYIAGVLNEGRNVLGMMPHPDRSSEALLGSSDGLLLFQAMAESLAATQ